jgi:hypothetical protein
VLLYVNGSVTFQVDLRHFSSLIELTRCGDVQLNPGPVMTGHQQPDSPAFNSKTTCHSEIRRAPSQEFPGSKGFLSQTAMPMTQVFSLIPTRTLSGPRLTQNQILSLRFRHRHRNLPDAQLVSRLRELNIYREGCHYRGRRSGCRHRSITSSCDDDIRNFRRIPVCITQRTAAGESTPVRPPYLRSVTSVHRDSG